MSIKPLLPSCKLGLIGSRATVLALGAGLSTLALSVLVPVLDQATWQHLGTPQLLPSHALVTPVSSTGSEPEAGSLNASTPESSTSPDTPICSQRYFGWLVVVSLALAACFGAWLWSGQGKRRPRTDKLSDDLSTVPPKTKWPSARGPAGDAAAPTAPRLQPEPLATADLPLEATTRLSSVDIVGSLVHELDSGDRSVRCHAIWELGQRGHSDAIQPLVNGLLKADSQEKSLILAALAEISSRSLKPMHRALELGLQDPSPEVRKNTIRDLSRVYDTVVQLSYLLAHASQDPDPGVQETAQWALNQLNRIAAAPDTATNLPASTALESSYDGQQSTLESHRLSPPHS